MQPDLRARIEDALAAAEAGAPAALDTLAVAGDAESDEAAASAVLVDAARWWYGLPTGRLRAPEELWAFRGAPEAARAIVARAALLCARASFMAFDADGLSSWRSLAEALTPAQSPVALGLGLRLAEVWALVLRGEPAMEATRDLGTAAAAARIAPVVVEAAALRALAGLAAGDEEEALESARRASRMGRTEALPDPEFLANLVLARVRRALGEPHLAARILTALIRHAPSPWQGWLTWELLLAEGPQVAADFAQRLETEPTKAFQRHSAAASLAMFRCLEAARAGRTKAFDAAASRVISSTAGFAPLAREAGAALEVLDLRRNADEMLEPWRRGQTEVLPLGLYGLAGGEESESAGAERAMASVAVLSDEQARRILSLASPLAAEVKSVVELPAGERLYGRTDAGLAALGLAGAEGMPVDEFFRAVYGFSYSPNLHRGSFNVLVHRMRKRADGFAEVLRDDQRLRLRVLRPFAVSDPRCVEPTVARVLRVLASRGTSKAEEVASALQVTSRTVQVALQQLVSDGACQVERTGREVKYRLDDTTFSEPTPWAGSVVPAAVVDRTRR